MRQNTATRQSAHSRQHRVGAADSPEPQAAVQRLKALTADPDVTAADLERVISQDPQLVEKVIQTAATGYKAEVTVSSVKRAVVLLGTRRLRNLADAEWLWRESA